MVRRSPTVVLVAVLAALVLATLGLTGCGLHQGRTALAIQRVESLGRPGRYRLVVECADDVTVMIGRDHGGSDLPELTVWGRPKVGRCHPDLDVQIGTGDPVLEKIVDGATSQVVELPT